MPTAASMAGLCWSATSSWPATMNCCFMPAITCAARASPWPNRRFSISSRSASALPTPPGTTTFPCYFRPTAIPPTVGA